MKRKLLSEEDKTAVAQAIKKAETLTSGEIVFALTDASAMYRHAIFQGALLGMAAATAIYRALPNVPYYATIQALALSIAHSIPILLSLQLVSLAVSYALFSYFPWKRWFISARELEARVREAALLEFYASGLYRTREENGVLIYLSVFERRVVVLGDRGIHEKMGSPHWDEVRDLIIQGVREGRAREGICAAVEACGKALAQHFPRRAGDVNELPDQVLDRTLKPDAS